MLKTLTVRNFALVDLLEINFGTGLTVITGESGAGKSILLGALGLVLGERASADVVRPGTTRAEVSAEFDITGVTAAQSYLAELELDDPDQPNRALIRRVVNQDGRSRVFLNGTPTTLGVLRKLTLGLVDVHGQHENQRIAQPDVQLGLLDDYGVDAAELDACRGAFRAWKAALAELAELSAAVANQDDRAALLSYQLGELDDCAPEAGEFEKVEGRHKRLTQAESLREIVEEAIADFENTDSLGRTAKQLQRIEDDHPSLAAARDALSTILALIEDTDRDLREYSQTLDSDPGQLQVLEERMSELHELARKHRVEPETLPQLIGVLRGELEAMSSDRSMLETWTEQAALEEARYRKHAGKISRQRRKAAKSFSKAVSACLNTLGIKGGSLLLEFTDRESEQGLESVEYHCITNPRYPAAPMTRIASGGERARISLAIAIIAAERCQLPCLVLDEADVGVGGTTADVVGRLLRSLSEHTQVICVTHAPQVAALGQHHLMVSKNSAQDTNIEPIDEDGRVDELARMLAGAGVTDKSRDYARTLLSEALDGPLH